MNGDGYNFKQLKDAILKRSVDTSWEVARLEWRLQHVHFVDEPETCLCGHFPIIEICVLKNIRNRNLAEVGNVCVKKFMGIRSDKIFNCIKRIQKDADKAPNAEMIALLSQQNLISDWEKKFSINTMLKRNLTATQLAKRREINLKILNNIVQVKI